MRFREQWIFGTLGKNPKFVTVMIPKKDGLWLSKNGLNKHMRFITRNPKKRFLSCSYGNLFEGGGDDYLRRESSQYEILCHSTLNPRLNV